MPFIFSNEICEKLAVVGFNTNMISYLTTQLHMPLTKAANTLTNFGGTASLTPLLGAFIADAYAGHHHVKLHSGQTSSMKTDPKQSTKTWKYFNWYYFVMGASMLLAVTMLVYIQDNIGWEWGLGIPTIAMFLSIITFFVGYPLYRHMDPAGSPFTRLLQVCVSAFRKRKLAMVSDPNLLYRNEELDASISVGGKLVHTQQMTKISLQFSLQVIPGQAAIVTEEDIVKSGQAPNLWRLNTVHRVEELKSVIRMGPIWAAGILLIRACAQQNTFSLQQTKTMDRHFTKSFEIPAVSIYTGLERGITFLHRMGIGFVISVLATLVAGFIEVKRKEAALAHGLQDKANAIIPISVFWLVPQYTLHEIAEAFMSIGHLEFFYDQSPESMRSTVTALFWTAISIGNYVSTMLVSLVHKFSAGADGSNWLPDNNLNKGKLEYFYWLITVLQVVNLVYYICCAKLYTYKPIQIHNKDNESEEDGAELGSKV
ncbi:Protein NRT1/ PTR FAMILY 3.1 [Hibiscus syriacus]|uniref:Protein NRT1/ PTR FAMILY 3.1 n=1 Tax=Hibiscus syriacus TaxID=106335 RepID=A0A6A2Z758_HIBSY|nr:Protein NRT1/ PTR FAMILY 3.1 [Hibiscus syriacus]